MLHIVGFFFKSSWHKIIIASIASAVSAGLNILNIKLLNDLIKNTDSDPFIILGQISLLVTGSAVITYFVGKDITKHFEIKIADYRKELANRVIKTDYSKTEKKLDRLIAVLLFEISTIGGFGKLIPQAFVALFQLVAVLLYLATISWQLTLLVFMILVGVTIVNVLTLPIFKSLENKLSHTRFRLHFALDRMERGFKDLIMNREHSTYYASNAIDKPSRETSMLGFKLYVIRTKIDSVVNAMIIIGFASALIFTIYYLKIDQTELIRYLTFFLFIIPSMAMISNFFKQVKNVENALIQIEEFDVDIKSAAMQLEEKISFQPNSTNPIISLDNISFFYGENETGFKMGPINMDIHENEVLIIKGGNGSGKSTLFKLITGLYTPKVGNVKFQGTPISESNVNSFRSYFACYFTDSPVFDDLGYIKTDMVKEKGQELIEMLELEGKASFDSNDEITDTNLSHGQRGRLNLLRVLLEDKMIYFFDEWAANQDPYFKKKFYTEIIPELKKSGKTVVLISHDDQYFDTADRIVTLENGLIKTQS